MKKYRTIACILVLLAVMLCGGASADYEGTDGRLFRALVNSGAWKDYAVEGAQAGPFAVMRSGNSCALFYGDKEDNLHVYPAAVYQPDDGKRLTREEKKQDNTAKTEKVAVLEMQFYFDSSQFNPAQRYTLLISDKYCGERRFDVNPETIR